MSALRAQVIVALLATFALAGALSGCAGLPSQFPSYSESDSATPSTEVSSSAEPTDEPLQMPVPQLDVTDLGESSCSRFEVCTFVNVSANEICSGAQIYVDLYDENDEYLDTESVLIGDLKKGQTAKNVEVGTDDTDADYVEQSDYSCN